MKRPFKVSVLRGTETKSYSFGTIPAAAAYVATLFEHGTIDGDHTIHAPGLTIGLQGFTAHELGFEMHRGEILASEVKAETPVKAEKKPKAKRLGEFKVVTLREAPAVDFKATTPQEVEAYFREHVAKADWYDPMKECCVVILLNTRRTVIGHNLVSLGNLDTSLIHPRELFRPAIVGAAHSIVILHNHPSGDPTPSEADVRVTREMIRAGQLLKIELVDHVVIGEKTADRRKGHASLRELGYFYS